MTPAPTKTRRIVSLVPSWTASLVDLGLEDALVGCTTFCVRPPRLRKTLPSVGGTKDADFATIKDLKPSHVVSCEEENLSETLARIETELPDTKLLRTFPTDPAGAMRELESLALELEAPMDKLTAILERTEIARQELENLTRSLRRESVHYFIWMNPWMVAGSETFISALLADGKLENAVQTGKAMAERYPVLDPERHGLSPKGWCLFSSEPFPFKQRHLEHFVAEHPVVSRSHCLKVDGQALSWYGSLLHEGYRELIRIRQTIAQTEV